MKKILLSITILCLSLAINAQNTPPIIKGNSTIMTTYRQQVCIDIETEDTDGDSVFIGVITPIPQSNFLNNNSKKRFATGSVCFTATKGVHSDNLPNTMVIYATDKKDTTYKTFSVIIHKHPNNISPVIEKVNYNTFRIDVKGDKSVSWGDFMGLKYQSKVYDPNSKLLLTDTNQVFTFTAPSYEMFILVTQYITPHPSVYTSRDTLYPNMNVSVISPQQNSFTIYPNPTTGKVFIENLPEHIEAITVFDVLGKEVKQLNIISNSFSIANLPAGIYWVEVETLQGVLGRQKIIKIN